MANLQIIWVVVLDEMPTSAALNSLNSGSTMPVSPLVARAPMNSPLLRSWLWAKAKPSPSLGPVTAIILAATSATPKSEVKFKLLKFSILGKSFPPESVIKSP